MPQPRDLKLASNAAQPDIYEVLCSGHFRARLTTLRLPSPDARPIRAVTVNGQDYKSFSGEEVFLPAGDSIDVVATY
jgi:hypothetical protein